MLSSSVPGRNKSEDVSRALTRAAAERRRIAQRVAEYAEMKDVCERCAKVLSSLV